ncbi:MAG: transcription elongation factor GreA [Chloroflexi bacterium]|jgi:transcription elongation factor GreA|nr:transcription elongation factor GreA [Chloroflexota bacterium]
MSNDTMYMTEKGFAKLEVTLARLKEKRLELAEQLYDSRVGGDSIDNTEYLMLRDEAALLENRILELDDMLGDAIIIQRGEVDGKIRLGNTVALQANGEPLETYTIVGRAEANPCEGCISNESPLGRALLDRAVGDAITVTAPEGEMHFRIIAVS